MLTSWPSCFCMATMFLHLQHAYSFLPHASSASFPRLLPVAHRTGLLHLFMHAKGDCQLLPLLPPSSSSSLAPLTSSPCMAFNPDLTCPVSFPLSPLQAVCTKLQSSCTYPAPIHAPVALQPIFIFPIHHQVPYYPSQSPATPTPANCQAIHLATALAKFICCWRRDALKSLTIKCHGGKTKGGWQLLQRKKGGDRLFSLGV